jgi:polysaccharide export outer membrane protein
MTLTGAVVVLHLSMLASPLFQAPQSDGTANQKRPTSNYVLGADDVIAVKVLDLEDTSSPSIRIDPSGHISLPLLGRVEAGGLTVEMLEAELSKRLKTYVHEPVVAVSVVEYRSQPVSVIGAVNQAGVHQLEGRKTLIEILAKAGGLRPEAGNTIKITRQVEWGAIPLSTAVTDPTGRFSVAEVSLKDIMQATNPGENIQILPNDVITVPRAPLVYIVGEVNKPGGFTLQERASISGLQALAMAEGFTNVASRHNAVIIRQSQGADRIEIPVNLNDILQGKKQDVELLPDDIFFVPTNVTKNAFVKVMQTALTAATSAVIYRGLY